MSFFKNLFNKRDPENQADINAEKEELASAGEFFPPLKGRIVPVTEVPDPVFSQKMMGDGFAIIPESGTVRSPIDGEVTNIFPTKHAISLRASDGRELLIHIGLETVSLKGEGFTALVKDGDRVKKGDRLVKVDFALVARRVPSTITSIVFTNLKDGEKVVIEGNQVSIKNDD
ncbi:hypothetical protein GCM10007968_12040 [Sporolactobacillus putidus]|uniref:PTS EIIA type-1 domain-containing protein n=2 Tax=Sporolactobacillus putidus TaxID=492735 RepID=A0A917S0S9_9BACL|nr:hypothetical protein GCM10007968_12040 [Sporolactobacillus putidus]